MHIPDMAANTSSPVLEDPFSSTQAIDRENRQSAGQLSADDENIARASWSDTGGHGSQQQEQERNTRPNTNNSDQRDGVDQSLQGTANIGTDSQPHNTDGDSSTQPQAWYHRLAEKYGALELDNKGSVARDHLALERTFLAWLRTSLSFASIGIAVTQLFRLNSTISCDNQSSSSLSSSDSSLKTSPYSSSTLLEVLLAPPMQLTSTTNSTLNKLRNIGKPIGATFIAIAILILVIGFHRYFESQYWIMRGKFPASRGSIALISFVAGGLVVASFVVILALAPNNLDI